MNATTLGLFAILAVLSIILRLCRPNRMRGASLVAQAAALHGAGTDPAAAINYAGNPFRSGAYVYVMETGAPSEHDWQGTYLGMQDGYALVRDEATHQVINVNKDQLYSANRSKA